MTGIKAFPAQDRALLTLRRRVIGRQDDEPAPVVDWLPAYAAILGAPPPRRLPVWAGRMFGGAYAVYVMTQLPGASNDRARAALGWRPLRPSWREDLAAAR